MRQRKGGREEGQVEGLMKTRSGETDGRGRARQKWVASAMI